MYGASPYSPPSWSATGGPGNRPYVVFPGYSPNAQEGFIDCARVDVPYTGTFDSDLTIAFWQRTTGLTYLFTTENNTIDGLVLECDGARRWKAVSDLGTTYGNSGCTSGVWCHVCFTLPLNGLGTIYYDGSAVGGYFTRDTLTGSSHENSLGKLVAGVRRDSPADYRRCSLPFDLSDFIIWPSILSTDEISWLANSANNYLASGKKKKATTHLIGGAV